MNKQGYFRKTVPLTDHQIKVLKKLQEFDGQDPLYHIQRAVDEYLEKQKFETALPENISVNAVITGHSADPEIARAMWLSGVVGKFEFSALIVHRPAKAAIDKGRILKLSIWDPKTYQSTKNFVASCIVNYDRGWDIRPSKIAQLYYDRVKKVLDESLASA